jgi:ribonuclease HI
MSAAFHELYTDGGASPNPGPTSASGVCVAPGTNTVVFAFSDYLGEATNNVGELTAILRGLTMAQTYGITHLNVYSDSELSVHLCQKTKKTTKPHLQTILDAIHARTPAFTELRFSWIEAHANHTYNEFADQMCSSMLQRVAELGSTSVRKPKPKTDTNVLYLNCPFQEKDQVKAMGARWDAGKKKWTVKNTDENRVTFEKWLS